MVTASDKEISVYQEDNRTLLDLDHPESVIEENNRKKTSRKRLIYDAENSATSKRTRDETEVASAYYDEYEYSGK